MALHKTVLFLSLLYLLAASPAMASDCAYKSDAPEFYKKHGLALKGPIGASTVRKNEKAWQALKTNIDAGDTLFSVSDRYSNKSEGFATVRNGCISGLVRLPKTEQRTIKGNGSAEICVELRAGQSLNLEFGRSDPLDFNIHYHIGNDTHYLAQESGITHKNSGHRSTTRRDYCMMWTNPGKDQVNLSTTYEVF